MSSSSSKPETKKKLLSLDSASLVDLKAEVFRKAQEAKFNQRHGVHASTSNKEKKLDKWNQKNSGVQQRSVRDADQIEKEEEARRKLEEKAEIYDRLQKEDGGEDDDRFLVDFGRKKKSPDDEWVEYTDALGRSRKCLKKDLPDLVRNDQELYKYKEEEARDRELEEAKAREHADLMSEDMRRELLRQKWEKEEEENLQKRNVHYQDVLFDEARTHGAGFYRFSRDENVRAAEQEELKDMHEETKKARMATERTKVKKKSAMAERLRKVKERKRLRKGLPIRSPDEDDEEKAEDGGDSDGGATDMTSEADIMENLKAMREEEEDKKRRQRVRDWDVGKEGVETSKNTGRHYYSGIDDRVIAGLKGEKKILSQGEWVDRKRTERPTDFAPPTNYDKGAKKQQRKRAAEPEPGPSPRAARAPQPHQQPQPDQAAFAVPAGFGSGMANPGYGFSSGQNFGGAPSGPQGFGLKGPFSAGPSLLNPDYLTRPPPPAGMYPPGASAGPPPPGPMAYPPGPRPGGPSGFGPPGTSGFRPSGPSGFRPPGPTGFRHPGPPGPRQGPPGPATRPMGPEMPIGYPGPQMPSGEEDEPRPGPSSMPVSLGDRLKMHRELSSGVGKPIVNEVNEGWRVFNEESSEEEEEEDNRGKGPEMAPPSSMEYFSSSTGYRKGFEYRKGFRSHEDIADSISAGMSKNKKDASDSDSD